MEGALHSPFPAKLRVQEGVFRTSPLICHSIPFSPLPQSLVSAELVSALMCLFFAVICVQSGLEFPRRGTSSCRLTMNLSGPS